MSTDYAVSKPFTRLFLSLMLLAPLNPLYGDIIELEILGDSRSVDSTGTGFNIVTIDAIEAGQQRATIEDLIGPYPEIGLVQPGDMAQIRIRGSANTEVEPSSAAQLFGGALFYEIDSFGMDLRDVTLNISVMGSASVSGQDAFANVSYIYSIFPPYGGDINLPDIDGVTRANMSVLSDTFGDAIDGVPTGTRGQPQSVYGSEAVARAFADIQGSRQQIFDFDIGGGGVANQSTAEYDITITMSLAAPEVPLPPALWLFMSAILGLFSMRRSNHKP